MRSGVEYLRSLNDGRRVFVDGELVKDVTAHRAFREATRSVANLYDITAAPELRERMTYPLPKAGMSGAPHLSRPMIYSISGSPIISRAGAARFRADVFPDRRTK